MSDHDPDLCRRVAAAVQVMELEMADRAVVARLVEDAARFEELPQWLRARVERAERSTPA
ncbi:hypothetical protein ACFXGA_06165 [Actinosynnema sp. NPDC059335]|uniref:hypothetical protein n=1 Tax=Actinosynnema sp. NPDC059335 TaxID=3346804 RepID=UPI00367229CE